MTDNDDKTAVGLSPGFYMFGVSPDTLIIQKMNVPIATNEGEIKKETSKDIKNPLCFNENEIDLCAE